MRFGFYDTPNREYVIDVLDVPTPWTNVLGIEGLRVMASHDASGIAPTCAASAIDRITLDIRICDDDAGECWSVSHDAAVRDGARRTCRHGLSYTTHTCAYHDVRAIRTLFVPIGDDVVVCDLSLKNTGVMRRRLTAIGRCGNATRREEWRARDARDGVRCDASSNACGAGDTKGGIGLFFAIGDDREASDGVAPPNESNAQQAFEGIVIHEDIAALAPGGADDDALATLQRALFLEPGQSARVLFFLGVGDRERARDIRSRYAFEAVDAARSNLAAYWDAKLMAQQVNTPDDDINDSLNLWNPYQAVLDAIEASGDAAGVDVVAIADGGTEGSIDESVAAQPTMGVVRELIAQCERGDGDAAMSLYRAILPQSHNDDMGSRHALPYAFGSGPDDPADGASVQATAQPTNPTPWAFGIAGAVYHAVVRHILGVQPVPGGLRIDPCIPSAWDGFGMRRIWRGALYEIGVENPHHACGGVLRVELDGHETAQPIPEQPVGTRHRVRVILGA